MRKIVSTLFISLDGVTESPQNWQIELMDDEAGADVGRGMEESVVESQVTSKGIAPDVGVNDRNATGASAPWVADTCAIAVVQKPAVSVTVTLTMYVPETWYVC